MLRGETYYYNDTEVLMYETTLRSSSSSSSTSFSSSSKSSSSKSSSSVSLPFRYQDPDPWDCYDELPGASSTSSSSSSTSFSSSSNSWSSSSSSSESSSSSSLSSSSSSSSVSSSSLSSSSSSSTSCYVSANDDFTGTDGDPPNVQRWIDVQNDGNLASIQNNKLNFYAPIGATNKEAIYDSRFTISGDFDIRIDFSGWDISGPSVESSHINFIVRRESDDVLIGHLRKRRKAPAAQYGSDGLDVTMDYAGSDDLSGKFRITRINGQIKTYVWDVDDWKWDGFTTGRVVTNNDNSDVIVQLYYKKDNDHSLEVDLDNFLVYSGLVNCMTSSSSQSSSSSSSQSGSGWLTVCDDADWMVSGGEGVWVPSGNSWKSTTGVAPYFLQLVPIAGWEVGFRPSHIRVGYLPSGASMELAVSSDLTPSGIALDLNYLHEEQVPLNFAGPTLADDIAAVRFKSNSVFTVPCSATIEFYKGSSSSSSSSESVSAGATFRITEELDSRVTEEGDERILESSSSSSYSSSSASFTFTFRFTEEGDDRITEVGDDRIIEP